MPRVVIALGGNALLQRGEPLDAEHQERNVAASALPIAAIAQRQPLHELIITHGNGPQVGLLALQALADPSLPAWPLHLLGAETDGMIGFLLEQAIASACPERDVATLLSRTIVDPDDPAFERPTKPIGPVYRDRAEAEALAQLHHWSLANDGDGVRRVVASPEPKEVTGLGTVEALARLGRVVICAGGGGIPVARGPTGGLRGVEAVVDKDLVAALVAHALDADALLLLTDVAAVFESWGGPDQRAYRQLSVGDARRRGFASGSMGPKVEAACRFAESGGARRRLAAIGSLHDAASLLDGRAGTAFVASESAPRYWAT